MKKVAVQFTYKAYVIEVPDEIAGNIRKYQHNFDKWLYDKSNDHGLWIIQDGEKRAVSFEIVDFVTYLNEVVLNNNSNKVRILSEEHTLNSKKGPIIYF